jgi:hypothetical protein
MASIQSVSDSKSGGQDLQADADEPADATGKPYESEFDKLVWVFVAAKKLAARCNCLKMEAQEKIIHIIHGQFQEIEDRKYFYGIFNGLAEGESETKSLDLDFLSFISNIAVGIHSLTTCTSITALRYVCVVG